MTILVIYLVMTCCLTYSACSSCNYCSILRPPCGCDGDCHAYKDCCRSYYDTSRNTTAPPLPEVFQYIPSGVEFQCISNHFTPGKFALDGSNGFFMVSSCPSNWENSIMNLKCRSSESTSIMPPVSDTATGLVYQNEYCAHCNEASEIVAWGVTLECPYEVLQFNDTAGLFHHLRRSCQPRRFEPANVSQIMLHPCVANIQSCLSYSPQFNITESQYNALVQQCHSGVLEPVIDYHYPVVYRNKACARCNLKEGDCFSPSLFGGIPFTITIKSLSHNHILVEEFDKDILVSCPARQVPVGLECRPTECPIGYTLNGGTCNYTNINCSERITLSSSSYVQLENGSVLMKSDMSVLQVLDYNDLGMPVVCKTLNCTTGLVALNRSEYELLENGSIIFQNTLLEVMYYDALNRPFICPERLHSAAKRRVEIFPTLPGIQELTYIGCSFSIVGTLMLLLTYILFPEYRTFPGLILMNMCAAILATNLIFVIGSPIIHYHLIVEICSVTAILLHYSYLAQFCWMSIFSCDIMRSFYLTRKLVQTSKETKHKLFLIYLAIAWISPLILVTISVTLNYSTDNLVRYGVDKQGEASYCWIHQMEFLIIFFLVPLVLSLSINIVTFVVTSVLLCLASRGTTVSVHQSKTRAIFRIWIATFLITGLTWLFGFLAFIGGSWVWYLFVIFNSTQGLTISIAFIFTKKIFKAYVQKLTKIPSLHDAIVYKNPQVQ